MKNIRRFVVALGVLGIVAVVTGVVKFEFDYNVNGFGRTTGDQPSVPEDAQA
jgi:hypothetical protein